MGPSCSAGVGERDLGGQTSIPSPRGAFASLSRLAAPENQAAIRHLSSVLRADFGSRFRDRELPLPSQRPTAQAPTSWSAEWNLVTQMADTQPRRPPTEGHCHSTGGSDTPGALGSGTQRGRWGQMLPPPRSPPPTCPDAWVLGAHPVPTAAYAPDPDMRSERLHWTGGQDLPSWPLLRYFLGIVFFFRVYK